MAAWQQDRFENGSALTNLTGFSADGGTSWTHRELPGISRCTGGQADRATDPVVAAGPDGRIYALSLTAGGPNPPIDRGLFSVLVNSSTDGGTTWTQPSVVQPHDGYFHDKPWIAADPATPGRAYVAWERFTNITPPGGVPNPADATGTEFLSRTDDGGRTWSTPKQFYDPGPTSFPQTSGLLVLPDGTLLFAFAKDNGSEVLPPGAQVPMEVVAMVSRDAGETWSEPRTLAEVPTRHESEESIRHFLLPTAAAAPDGTTYVVWHRIDSDADAQILFSKSRDRGESWTPPKPIRTVSAQAFTPSVAVGVDGTVAVTYYDLRNDKQGDNEVTADWWFSHSHDGGASWDETHLAGPFDMRTAVKTGAGYFIGDYFALVPLEAGFGAAIVQSKPAARHGRSDVFFARVQLGDEAGCLSRRSPIGSRNIGRIRLGFSRRRLLRIRVPPLRRTRRYYRYCVKRSRGRVIAVFSSRSRRGRVRLVTTTARGHGNRRVRVRSKAASFRRAYPNRRRIARGLYRANPRSRRLFGLRRGRVRFIAVANGRLLRKPRTLRRYLRLAGVPVAIPSGAKQ